MKKNKLSSRRSRANAGFTLVEMLCAIVVCLLATALATLAIDMSSRSMTQQTSEADAKILCSTLSTAISDELRLGKNYEMAERTDKDAANFTYFSLSRKFGHGCRIVNAEDGTVMVDASGKQYPLLPTSSYMHNEKAKCTLTLGDDGNINVQVYIMKGGTEQVLAQNNFTVRPMTE